MVVAHDQLGVDQDVSRENQSRDDAIAKIDFAIVWEESGHEAEQNQDPDATEQVWGPVRKVILALAGEQTQSNEDAHCEDERGQDDSRFVHGDDDGDGVRLHGGKAGEEGQVHGVRFALPEGKAEEDKGTDERHPHHPLICLDPVAVCDRGHGESANTGCCEELDSPASC